MRPARLLWMLKVLAYRARYRGAFSIAGFGLSVGRHVTVAIEPPGRIDIGRGVQLRDGCELQALGAPIRIAPNVFFNRNCTIVARAGVEIGSDCIFGPNVGVFDNDHRFEDPEQPIWAQPMHAEPVRIGSNVWIGANAVITAGVEIGDRVVVGANAVVTKSLAGGGLYVGNPATLLRQI
jgi:maltose O-acetyltransferase